MKRLFLFRHAKSDWHADFRDDHSRPLSDRGRRDAKRVGRFLRRSGRLPDVIVSSTALRARTTVELAAREGDWPATVELSDELYGATVADVVRLAVVRLAEEQEDPIGSLMLVGHEPTWSRAASTLVGGGRIRVPTAAVVCLRFERDWRSVGPGAGQLEWMVIPKLLRDGAD